MNRYVAVFQEHNSDAILDLDELVDRGGVLRLELINLEGKKLHVVFDDYLAYRKLDEGDALLALQELSRSAQLGLTFYRVEQSDFVVWFTSQNFGIREARNLMHYVVMTLNDVIDVISLAEPRISLID